MAKTPTIPTGTGFGGFGQPPHSEMPPTAVKTRDGKTVLQDAHGHVVDPPAKPATPDAVKP